MSNINNQLIIENFRSWRGRNYIDLNRINLFFGSNSSGKSSVLHALALLKQSWAAREQRRAYISNLIPKGDEIDLGRLEDQISRPASKRKKDIPRLRFGIRFNDGSHLYDSLPPRHWAMESQLSERPLRQEIIKKLFSEIGPLDLIISYDYLGRITGIQLDSASGNLLKLTLEQTKKKISIKFEIDRESQYWNNLVSWNDLLESHKFPLFEPDSLQDIAALQSPLQNKKQELIKARSELAELDKGRDASPKDENKWRELIRRIQWLKRGLNVEALESLPLSWLGENPDDTKTKFFDALETPFSISRDPNGEVGSDLRELLHSGTFGAIRRVLRSSAYDFAENETTPMPLLDLERALRFRSPGGFNVVMLMDTCLCTFADFIARFERIGPHRERPDRITFINPNEKKQSIGAKGENVAPIIYRATKDDIKKINSWLERLEIGYELRKRFTSQYNIAEIRLVDPDRNEIALADVGYGIGQILPVVMASVLQRNRVIVIEQPELHLHPKLQANLIDLFVWSAEELENTFFLETHSEHMVLRMQRRQRELDSKTEFDATARIAKPRHPHRGRALINRWDGISSSVSIQVVTVEEGPKRSSAKKLRITSKGEFSDHWPGDFFPERFFEKGLY